MQTPVKCPKLSLESHWDQQDAGYPDSHEIMVKSEGQCRRSRKGQAIECYDGQPLRQRRSRNKRSRDLEEARDIVQTTMRRVAGV
jgi:hypothetical protein